MGGLGQSVKVMKVMDDGGMIGDEGVVRVSVTVFVLGEG